MKTKPTKQEKALAKEQKKALLLEQKEKEKQRKQAVKQALKNATTKQERKQIKKEARKNAPKMKKTTLVNIIIICMVGVISGIAIGVYFGPSYLDPNRYNFDVATLRDDVVAIKKEAKTKSPTQLGATKCCVLAFDKTFNCPSVSVTGTGSVKAMGVTQTINAKTIRLDDQIYYENISVSKFVKALNRYYVDGEEIKQYGGDISGNTVTWHTSPNNTGDGAIKTMTQYQQQFGSTMNEYMTYIVSSKTVTKTSNVTQNSDGNYTFTLSLDRSKSVVNYVKSMKATGGLKEYPDFTQDPQIYIVMDAEFRILQFTSNEKYTVSVGISAKSDATLTNIFSYDQDFIIPQITDKSKI